MVEKVIHTEEKTNILSELNIKDYEKDFYIITNDLILQSIIVIYNLNLRICPLYFYPLK